MSGVGAAGYDEGVLLSLALFVACHRSPAPLVLLTVKQIPQAPTSQVPARRFVGYIEREGVDIAGGCQRRLVKPSMLLVEVGGLGMRFVGEPVADIETLEQRLRDAISGMQIAEAAGCRPWGESEPAVLIAIEPDRTYHELFAVLRAAARAGFVQSALLVGGVPAPQSVSGKEHALLLSQPDGWYIQDNSARRAWTVDDDGLRGWLLEHARSRPLGALVIGAGGGDALGRVMGPIAAARGSGLACLALVENVADTGAQSIETTARPAPVWLRSDVNIDVLPVLMLRPGGGDAHLVDGTTCHFDDPTTEAGMSYGGARMDFGFGP